MPKKTRIDMTGMRFGRLVALGCAGRDGSGHARWRFACDCGRETVATGKNVRAGNTTSCGCFHRAISAARLLDHGHRAAHCHEPTYRAWQQLRRASHPHRICRSWERYAAFLADVGERPAATRLVLVNPALPFGPGNCRWVPLEPRATRAARGWQTRRDRAAQSAADRTESSQSRSAPSAAASILPSIAL